VLKKILLGLVAVVAVLLVVVATRPADYRVERSLVIQAPPDTLFGAVADFHAWDKWSPWAKLDPAMKTDFQGPTGEVGSSYSWTGNDKVGEGRMTITAVQPGRQVKVKLEFLKPWASTTETVFDLFPETGGTRVVWIMRGQNDFVGKAMCLFMDMDKMIGPDFERGLSQLKQGAEGGAFQR
jgi:uncharacterized protein YndB with AHSA1/START domain